MFSNILSFLSSRNVKDQFSHPYKQQAIIIIIIIIIIIQVVRTHQHNTDSAVLQTARWLKTSTERNKKNERKRSGENKRKMTGGRRYMDNCHVT
jgi:uncharacterized protein YxeA